MAIRARSGERDCVSAGKEGWDEDAGVVDEASDDGGAGRSVREQEGPSCGAASDGRERVGGVFIERAGRGGGAGEARDAERDE